MDYATGTRYFFGGPNASTATKAPFPLGTFLERARAPIELPQWGSLAPSHLNRYGSPLVNPDLALPALATHDRLCERERKAGENMCNAFFDSSSKRKSKIFTV